MKFECGDLERALAMSELMPEAREHLKYCAACRREYRLWAEISSASKDLHEQWDSPDLWPAIRKNLEAEPKPKRRLLVFVERRQWKTWAVAASVLVVAGVLALWLWRSNFGAVKSPDNAQAVVPTAANRDFLTDQALQEVEKTEAAYRHSIDRLSQLAGPQLQNPPSELAANYKEKLLMLDSAISETRTNLEINRFNIRLQTELANLYREKQQTLRELLTRDQKN